MIHLFKLQRVDLKRMMRLQILNVKLLSRALPVKLACEKMQLIWDAIFPGCEYIVTSTSAVYLLVSMFEYTVQSINTIYRLFNGLQTHGVTPLGRLDFRLLSRTLSLRMTSGILTRIELSLPSMHSMSSGSVTRRPAAMILM